jgi:peptidoglycan L-alanyl-D-glutamate endopeptidase CwlK
MASRDKKDLRPELVQAYERAADKYKVLYPNDPQPFITCTYRSFQEQNDLYIKVPKVTNAKGGQSPHNYNPSFAFDIAFITVENKVTWAGKYFKMFAELVKESSEVVSWGGDWINFKDAPHFELKNWKTYLPTKK